MNFGQAVSSVFSKYASMQGRASRSEYWYWYLFNFLVTLIPAIWFGVESSSKEGFIGTLLFILISLALLIPNITVEVRRLHDSNRSGGWWWIRLVPFAGSIIVLVFMLMPSVNEGNRFN